MQSSKTFKAVPSSGTSKRAALPRLLPYPQFLPYETTEAIRGLYCYIFEHYGTEGLSVLVYREPENDQVTVLCGNWKGELQDLTVSSELTELAMDFLKTECENLIAFMQVIKLKQAQYFFAPSPSGLVLVDVQTAVNKLLSPGTVEEIFGKHFRTPAIRKKEVLDERAQEQLLAGTGSYAGDLILKPSAYREFHDQAKNSYQPMYVDLRR